MQATDTHAQSLLWRSSSTLPRERKGLKLYCNSIHQIGGTKLGRRTGREGDGERQGRDSGRAEDRTKRDRVGGREKKGRYEVEEGIDKRERRGGAALPCCLVLCCYLIYLFLDCVWAR